MGTAATARRLLCLAGVRPFPLYLVFFVTDRCNARCRHCLFGDGTVYPAVGRELSLGEIEAVARTVGPLLFLLPTGGEPFLRDDLADIVRVFHEATGVRDVAIPTNGSLTAATVAAAEAILASCPRIRLGIDVSLDAVGPAHDGIRGVPGLFEKAVATFRALQGIAARDRRLEVNIETTVSSLNDRLLLENYDYFARVLRPSALFTLLVRGRPRDPACRPPDMERYRAYADRLERGLLDGEISGYRAMPLADVVNAKRIVRHRLIARIARERRCLVPCAAGRLGAALFANGDVYPCELRTDLKLGNVREERYDFSRIWRGAAARGARKRIRRERCACTYECFLTLNILFSPRFWPALARQWLRLKAARLSRRVRNRGKIS
ncbi:MAG: radical SAM protein [bacterium]|nr:radical SAM protein [bacterium]